MPYEVLYQSKALNLLLPAATGHWYENQVGGYSCQQLKLEGHCIGLRDEADALFDYFWKELGGYCLWELPIKSADRVDNILRRYNLFPALRVDRTKLKQSCEAWVHVQIVDPDFLLRWIDAPTVRSGVLTWQNSD